MVEFDIMIGVAGGWRSGKYHVFDMYNERIIGDIKRGRQCKGLEVSLFGVLNSQDPSK